MDRLYYQWLGNLQFHSIVWIASVALSVVVYTMITRIRAKLERLGQFRDIDWFETIFGSVFTLLGVGVGAFAIVMTLPYFLVVVTCVLFIHICVNALVKKKNPWVTFTDLFSIFAEKKK